MSLWQRVSTDCSNAVSDVYSHWVLGDDAGKSLLVSLLQQPSQGALGLTFLEVNGRAYVSTVQVGSAAHTAGVLPQDAVQLAVTVAPDARPESALRFAADLEQKGARSTYDQLHRLLRKETVLQGSPAAAADYFLSPLTTTTTHHQHNASHKGGREEDAGNKDWNEPPRIPTTICAPVGGQGEEEESADMIPKRQPSIEENSSSGGGGGVTGLSTQQSVVFVFRRTRQRQSTESAGLLAFRLDDECDLACSLVRRLAPTADMQAPSPDTWEELVHDGTDFLLGPGSMLPPKGHQLMMMANNNNNDNNNYDNHGGAQPLTIDHYHQHDVATETIPLDDFEKGRAQKLATLRSRMTAEAIMQRDRSEDVEAATIRGMIQKAVGLAFVRASKIVLGVSLHGGSGIVVSRLSDGTWSAPSAIGTWGLGLGLQFGLEVAEYIFILQTHEALEHFRRGGSYTVGGNMGVAIGGLGREAYGAASVGGGLCGTDTTSSVTKQHDDEYNDETDDSRDEQLPAKSMAIAPIVAYAKSQGLYVGVSLEGSRIFTRKDINSRTYKFTSGRDVSANDILSGKVPTPPEAEELYAALHSVEFTHEMSCLPRPPEILRKDSANAWNYDRSTLAESMEGSQRTMSSSDSSSKQQPFSLFSKMSQRNRDECETFEAQFKNFMYGGVSVQRLLPDTEGRTGRTGKERRTLWLMLPEVGSLRLGFVSKLSDGEGAVSNKSSTLRARREDPSRMGVYDGDLGTVGSEELTIDTALQTRDGSTIGPIRTGNVQLSDKHSVALTDVSVLSQEPLVPIKFKGDDKTQHLRVISIQDVAGTSLLFLANNFREAELLVCGLKLLLERETARLGVRGGLPIMALGGRNKEGAMSPAAARGFRDAPSQTQQPQTRSSPQKSSGYNSSVGGDDSFMSGMSSVKGGEKNDSIPSQKGRNWGKQPGRDYMRGQAASMVESEETGLNEQGVPHYAHGKQIVRDIVENIRLPLPLPLCRVLLLDSTSPVIKQWEKERGDKNFEKTRWAFPPATPRELERHSSEHQLIASGSMCGAHQTSHFDRPRYGSYVRLSETHTVDADDPKKVSFTVTERNPRRGFSLKVRVVLRANKDDSCDASVFAELRPVGKDMSNQAAVHKAFLLVQNEIRSRYGMEGSGLLAGFLSVVDNMAESTSRSSGSPKRNPSARPYRRTNPNTEVQKKTDPHSPVSRKDSNTESGLVSFEDMLKTGRESPESSPKSNRPETPSLLQHVPESNPKRLSETTSLLSAMNDFAPLKDEQTIPTGTEKKKDAVLIEVKPLPKIRLSLMPSPREEDEENSSSASPIPSKPTKKKKKKMSSSYTMSKSRKASPRKCDV